MSLSWIISGVIIFLIIRYLRRKSYPRNLVRSMDLLSDLGMKIKKEGDFIYSEIQAGKPFKDPKTQAVNFGSFGRYYISMLQLRAIANIVREKGFIKSKDQTHFLELLYIALTGNPPDIFHIDLERLPFTRSQQNEETLKTWAQSMVSTATPKENLNNLDQGLLSVGVWILYSAQIKTCQVFGDLVEAENLLNSFKETTN